MDMSDSEETTSDHPLRYQKYYRYYSKLHDGKTYGRRVLRAEYTQEEADQCTNSPCWHSRGFSRGDCIECGAVEEVVNRWKGKGKHYLGNNIIRDNTRL